MAWWRFNARRRRTYGVSVSVKGISLVALAAIIRRQTANAAAARKAPSPALAAMARKSFDKSAWAYQTKLAGVGGGVWRLHP
jgi:hypothetical protein